MTILTASKARIPTEEFNRVAYKGEIVAVERRGGQRVFIISATDLEVLRRAKLAHEKSVDEAGDRAIRKYSDLLHSLA